MPHSISRFNIVFEKFNMIKRILLSQIDRHYKNCSQFIYCCFTTTEITKSDFNQKNKGIIIYIKLNGFITVNKVHNTN